MRKPIQITTSTAEETDGSDTYPIVITTALCDDGTIWQTWGNGRDWWPLKNIPQEPVT